MSTRRNPSGSALERATHCPASEALPVADHTGEAAEVGVENHANVELAIKTGNYDDVHPVVGQLMEGKTWAETEVAFAINVVTEKVRRIGAGLERRYGKLEPEEIALTIDAIIARPGEVLVTDWKSRERVTPAARNLQIRAAAVAVMKYTGAKEVQAGLVYLDDGEQDWTTVDAFTVALFFAEMRELLNKIGAARLLVSTGAVPDVHSGSWCKYCPALPYCPAQTRTSLAMLGELTDIEQKIAFMSEEQVGRAWVIKKQIQTVLERVDASLRLRAQHSVVPLPNGKRLALIDKTRRSFNKEKALTRIHELGGETTDLYKLTSYTQVSEVNMPKNDNEEGEDACDVAS